MGLPPESREELRPLANISWGLDSTLSARNRTVLTETIARHRAPLLAHVDKTLQTEGASLIHRLHSGLPPGENDKVGATAALLAVMLVMGNDALGGCITFPVWEMLRGEHEALPQARWAEISDDAIRYAAPVSYSTRRALTDTAVGGCPFRKGEIVMMSPFAANHDPARFGPVPRALKPRPELGTGMAFGAGPHSCVGLRISRSIAQIAFQALAALPEMTLSGPVTQGPGKVVRTVTSLPVQFH
jgi:cytochrome P450